MSDYKELSIKEVEEQYKLIKKYHDKYLKKYGVKLSPLYNNKKQPQINALVLVYLSLGYPKTKVVSKEELTMFVRSFYSNVNDVQQGRHLGAQDGWYIAAGGRDNIVVNLKRGEYQLHTLEQPYPSFKKGHRVSDTDNWEELKAQYGYRCATCGSREGEPHFHWPGTETKLQKSHKDSNKPLVAGNIIPQCQKCNRADRDRWVYDEKGRVIKLAKPSFILNSDEGVLWAVYRILYKKYKGRNPNEKK